MTRGPDGERDVARFATIAHALHERGARQPAGWAYTFLADGEGVEQRITYGELDARARGIARRLTAEGARGERVLLLYPPGLDYIAAFFGCLYAGAVAVPAYPPDPARLARSLPRLQAIVGDSGARVILTTSPILAMTPMLLKQTPDLAVPTWLASDRLAPIAPDGDDRLPAAEELAFLQYTSGSTTAPKGAMVSHRNIIANQRMIARGFGSDEHDVGVGWLPFYHDMGLIGNVLHPMYVGYPFVLMSPIAFLQQPIRWLRAITRYRARVSGGPNFAYEMCARRIGGADLDGLELSSWVCAFNGAEPIRPATIERFAAVFGPCGFRREAFYPCYGLAEATLIATGGRRGGGVTVRAAAGDRGRGALVGCGQALLDERVVVVDPQRATRCDDGVEGEIWIAGDNVAEGYWRQPAETARAFGGVLAGDGDARYLRTGDLGMMVDGELFVAGRMKDLIIVRGRNVYPQDVEATVEAAHPAVRSGAVAAFAFVAEDGEEEVGVAAEVVIGDDELMAVREAITAAAVLAHDVAPALIVLLDRGRLPKTSSGKLQRRATGAAAAAGELEARSSWRAPRRAAVVVAAAPVDRVDRLAALAPERRLAAVREFLVGWLAGRSGAAAVDPRAAFASQGVDSRDAVELAAALEGWLGRPVAATVAYDHPSIDQLAAWAAGEVAVVAPIAARAPDEPIAIIGLGCRVPGADDPAAFWRLLQGGVDGVAEIPAARIDLAALFAEEPARGHTYVRRAALFDQVDRFDAAFFAITPREAASLDPQQRLLLEVAWSAIEDSGRSPRALSGTRTGVFVGIATSDYAAHHLRSGDPDRIDAYTGTGTAFSTAAGRISYVLGATGPSMAIDTACSSSLTAVHQACQSLRTGESDLALAGGVNVILAGESFVYLSQLRALAPDGRCKAFDRRADGYGRGEGCAVVVLKRLADALRDGDPIHAVVRGSAVNQDGASNGLTAPSGPAQTAVIRAALERAGVTADQIDYVEAHGTGTPLGDPIELNALGAALSSAARPGPLWVGSVKTNIGHTEAAAGVLGLCKTVLALGHEELSAHLHLQEPTPHVAWSALGLAVPAQRTPWPRGTRPRFAGVSSFGLSGTNVHLVLEEAPAVAAVARAERPAHLLTWSAATPAALIAQGARLADWLAERDAPAAEACAALAHGRNAQPYRAAVVGGDAAALAEAIRARGARPAPEVIDRALRIGFLFTGQGSQVVGMGSELARTVPSFRRALDRCAAALDRLLPVPLDRLLAADLDAATLAETGLAQPALFAVEYALAETWRSWGVEPVAVLGHSLGELVAACVAGVLSVADACVLVAHRGRLMQGCVRGAMAAIGAAEAVVVDVIERHRGAGTLAIASINAPDQVVIAGEADRVDAACAELIAAGVSARRLDVSHAFHSAHMAPASVELARIAATLTHAPARVPVVSTRWGRAAAPAELDASYWPAQMLAPVRFADAMGAMIGLGVDALIELGPQPILLGTHRRIDPASPVLSLPSLVRNRAELALMLGSLAALVERGHTPPWDEVVGPRPARPLGLPTYAFQRERHWIDAPGAVVRAPRPTSLEAPAVASAGTAPPVPHGRDEVAARLQLIVGDLLGLAPARVEVDVPLADLGADSIILVEGLQRVQQELGVRIGLREALSTLGTITALADHIAAALTRRLAVGTADHVAIRAAYHLAVGTAQLAVIADSDAALPSAPSALDARRSAHVAALVERYAARTRGSKARKAASHAGLADVRAAAGFRTELSSAQREAWLATKELGYPIVGARSQGARIWDLDDNAYVDLAMGFGVHLFGHNPPFVVEALQQQLARGLQLGPLADGAVEVAALLRELTGVERVALCGSGSEAVATALRLARARVGRPLVVAFAGSYHGASDGVLPVIPFTRGCGPGVERDLLVLEYGNPQSLAIIAARAHELSAVLVEPVQGRRPELQPREFLHELRAITARHGVALIFDEVLVGFRIGPGGAQAHFGVEADLVTYGKIVGGGMPIGVVAGRADFLDGIDGGAWRYGDRSLPATDTIWFAGTFNKHPLSMAAAVATLRTLRDEGPALQLALNRRTAALVDTLNGEFARAQAPIEAVHFGSLLRLHLPRSLELLYHHLIDRGVYVWEGRSMFLSTAHGDAEVAHVVDAVRSSLAELGDGGFLEPAAPRAEAVRAPVPVIGPRPARVRPAPAAAARLRLCCLPYAGGGSSTYLSWGPSLDSRITLHPVELAGRDGRASEPPHTDHGRLIDALVTELRPTLANDTGPCVLFGHSMGALLAYGLARRLIAEGLRPALLVVSGEPAPHLTQRPLVPTHALDDAALIELMLRHGAPVELRDRELSAGALRLLRADLAVCESFVAGEPEPLDVPIVAFAGDADPLAAVAAVAGWERHTRGRFAMHTLAGDHFFIRRSRDRLLALLQRELAPCLVDVAGPAADGCAPLITADAT